MSTMRSHKLPSTKRCPAPYASPPPSPARPSCCAAMCSSHFVRQLRGVASQRLALHRRRRCSRVFAAAQPLPAPSGDRQDGPAWRAYWLEYKVFGTVSKEAVDAAIAEHRRFEALAQPSREEQQARMEVHDRLLRTTPQEAAAAPSANTAAPQPPTAGAPPVPSATNRPPFGAFTAPSTPQPPTPAPLMQPPLAAKTASAPSNALAAAAAAGAAVSAVATALAFSKEATEHEAAAKAAQSANQPELAAKELERAAAMRGLAPAAWSLASQASQQLLLELAAVR